MSRPIEKYRVIKDLPTSFGFIKGRVYNRPVPKITAGMICRYFKHGDCYCFDVIDSFAPFIERNVVERWSEYFEAVEDSNETS